MPPAAAVSVVLPLWQYSLARTRGEEDVGTYIVPTEVLSPSVMLLYEKVGDSVVLCRVHLPVCLDVSVEVQRMLLRVGDRCHRQK